MHNPNLKHLHFLSLPWASASTVLPSIIIQADFPCLETLTLSLLQDKPWPDESPDMPQPNDFTVFEPMDLTLADEGTHPAFTMFTADLNGTADDDQAKDFMERMVNLRERSAVSLTSVAEATL